MKLAVRLSLVLALALLALAGCAASSSSGGCSVDTDCDTGKICLNSACEVQGCEGPGDCYQGQTCVDVDNDGSKECTANDCQTDADCAAKAAEQGVEMYCKLGACLVKQVVQDDVIGGDVQKDTPEQDTAEVEEDTGTPTDGAICKACTKDEDCGSSICSTLPEGDFCLPSCASNDECPSGFLCLELTTQGKQCVPGLYNKCADCLVTPCGAGQYCDQIANACKAVKAECAQCIQDDECGQGSRCLKLASGQKACVPECGANDACPEKSSCQTLTNQQGTEGVKACAPQGSACCFGAACQIVDCSAEPTNKYVGPAGTCVQCLQDAHCPLETPKCNNNQCSSPSCSAPTPIACAQGASGCCECTNSSHCTNAAKPNCDVASGVCVEGTGDCGCVDPYPGCITVEGQVMCVECTEDSHCQQGCACDTAQYVCVDPAGGGYCNQGLTGCTGNCQSSGCVDTTGQYPNLACDATSGCCFDGGGMCDNVTAFCVQPGQECKSIMDLFGGGMGGGSIPGLPGGGAVGIGFCNCTGDMAAQLQCLMGGLGGGIPGLPGGSTDVVCCPSGMVCMDAMQLLGSLGGSGTPTTGTGGLCVDLTSLLGGIAP